MWWYFRKIREHGNIVTYSYGFESKELTGLFEYDKGIDTTKILKYADNHTERSQRAAPLPAYLLIKRYGAPAERMIAFG